MAIEKKAVDKGLVNFFTTIQFDFKKKTQFWYDLSISAEQDETKVGEGDCQDGDSEDEFIEIVGRKL